MIYRIYPDISHEADRQIEISQLVLGETLSSFMKPCPDVLLYLLIANNRLGSEHQGIDRRR
jgi:hypothetical protein